MANYTFIHALLLSSVSPSVSVHFSRQLFLNELEWEGESVGSSDVYCFNVQSIKLASDIGNHSFDLSVLTGTESV